MTLYYVDSFVIQVLLLRKLNQAWRDYNLPRVTLLGL